MNKYHGIQFHSRSNAWSYDLEMIWYLTFSAQSHTSPSTETCRHNPNSGLYLVNSGLHLVKAGLHLTTPYPFDIDLTTPEPRRDEGLSETSSPPVIKPGNTRVAPIVDLSTPEPDHRVALVVDLSTPKPEQLVAALSVSSRAPAMSQCRPTGLQLLTPDLRRYLLDRRPHPRQNGISNESTFEEL